MVFRRNFKYICQTAPLQIIFHKTQYYCLNTVNQEMDSIEELKHLTSKKKYCDSSSFQVESDSGSGVSHQNSECVKREKKQKLKRKKKRIYSTKSKGNWELQEDVRFMTFMVENRDSFENRDLRRSNKIFKKMARFIKTRCPEQCRSHHQKYQKKYVTFDQIVSFIENKASRVQQESIKKEQIKGSNQDQQLHKKDKDHKQKINNEKQKGQDKAQNKTIPPPPFQLLKDEDGYNIFLSTPPGKLELKIVVDIWSMNTY